jgi:hypothetical protein
MRIGIESGGVNFTERILKNIENVSRLVDSTPNEAAEQGNIIVRDVPIGDSARVGLIMPTSSTIKKPRSTTDFTPIAGRSSLSGDALPAGVSRLPQSSIPMVR